LAGAALVWDKRLSGNNKGQQQNIKTSMTTTGNLMSDIVVLKNITMRKATLHTSNADGC